MQSENHRTTIYLSPDIFRALKLKAMETSRSVSELVNDAVRHELLEDMEDLAALEERKDEPTISFEAFVKKLKADGKL